MDILSYCDGEHTKQDIANIFGLKEFYVLNFKHSKKKKNYILLNELFKTL